MRPPHLSGGGRRPLLAVAVLAALALGITVATPMHPSGAADPPPSFARLDLRRAGGEPVHLADPDVLHVDGAWYLYGTSGDRGFEVWRSDDLITWVYGGVVWTPTPGSWSAPNSWFWAPDLYAAPDGTVWLYYTANQRIGLARADSPLGPFVDVFDHPLVGDGHGGVGDGVHEATPSIIADLDDKAIDANLFEASDGRLYLYFSRYTFGRHLPISEIAVLPMADPTTPASATPSTVLGWDGHLDSWEWLIREAPFAVEHDGVVHLMYSGNIATSTCYAVGDATSTDPLGPFTRRTDNPMLKADPSAGFFGPGHNGVTDGPDGGLLAFFHVNDEEAPGGSRSTGWSPLTFDPDGAITIHAPGGDIPSVDPACTDLPVPGDGSEATPTAGPTAVPLPPAAPAPAVAGRATFAG